MFNFLSCSAVAQAVKMSAGDALVQTGMVMGAHAIILPLVIYSAMETSGAHFNPMVTSCFVALGKLVNLSSFFLERFPFWNPVLRSIVSHRCIDLEDYSGSFKLAILGVFAHTA